MKKEEPKFYVDLVKYDLGGKPYYTEEDGSHRDLTESELKQLENFKLFKKLMSPDFIRPIAFTVAAVITASIAITAFIKYI